MCPYFFDKNLQEDDEETNLTPGTESDFSSDGEAQGQAGASKGAGASKFQNLENYLNNNDSKAFGQEVVGKVSGDIKEAKQAMNTASGEFKDQVGSGGIPTHEQIDQTINTAGSEAVPGANQPAPSTYQDWMKNSYQGPKSLAESQSLHNKYWSGTKDAATKASLLGNEAGRFTLLDSYFGRPDYSFGEKALDNHLLQSSGSGRKSAQLQNQATQLKSLGRSGEEDLQNLASQRNAAIGDSAKYARDRLGVDEYGKLIRGENAGALGKLYDDVDTRWNNENNNRNQQYLDFREQLANKNVWSPEFLQTLGLTDGQQLFGIDPYDLAYLKKNEGVTQAQVMSPTERARLKALGELSGVEMDFSGGDDSPAGAAYLYDSKALQGKIGARKAAYENEMNAWQDAFDTKKGMPRDGRAGGRASWAAKMKEWKAQIENKYKINQKFSSGKAPADLPTLLDRRAPGPR